MNGFFSTLLSMSLSASWLILAVLLLRQILKKSAQMDPCSAVGHGGGSAPLSPDTGKPVFYASRFRWKR